MPTTAKIKVATSKKVVAPKKEIITPVEKKVEVKKIETKLAKYSHSNLKVSPRKLRLLVNDIKKLNPVEAATRLRFTNSNAARLMAKSLKIAIDNAKNNYHLEPSSLKFAEARVDEGQKIKRMDKSHGSRFARGIIMKRHSRLTIVLSGTIQS